MRLTLESRDQPAVIARIAALDAHPDTPYPPEARGAPDP